MNIAGLWCVCDRNFHIKLQAILNDAIWPAPNWFHTVLCSAVKPVLLFLRAFPRAVVANHVFWSRSPGAPFLCCSSSARSTKTTSTGSLTILPTLFPNRAVERRYTRKRRVSFAKPMLYDCKNAAVTERIVGCRNSAVEGMYTGCHKRCRICSEIIFALQKIIKDQFSYFPLQCNDRIVSDLFFQRFNTVYFPYVIWSYCEDYALIFSSKNRM